MNKGNLFKVGVVMLGMAVIGLGMFAGIYTVRSNEYEENLLRRTLVKADKNQDKILQKQEISDLLKQLNVEYVLSDDVNTPIPTRVGEKSRITYFDGRSQIVLGRKDLENYLK